jgi:phosphogluconate 2-dehydrogenase
MFNTSRGKTQQEHALFEGLTRGKIRAASIDVFEEEPVSADNPLLNLPNVVVSSHVAGVTTETDRATAMQVTAEMLRVLRGEQPQILGNPDLWPKLTHLR